MHWGRRSDCTIRAPSPIFSCRGVGASRRVHVSALCEALTWPCGGLSALCEALHLRHPEYRWLEMAVLERLVLGSLRNSASHNADRPPQHPNNATHNVDSRFGGLGVSPTLQLLRGWNDCSALRPCRMRIASLRRIPALRGDCGLDGTGKSDGRPNDSLRIC